MRTCSVEGCDRDVVVKSMCTMHYRRVCKHGDAGQGKPLVANKGEPLRFLKQVVLKHSNKKECLIWPHSRGKDGYGQIIRKGRSQRVSRLVCQKIHGKPPTRQHHSRHSCGNGHLGCVNPWHLSWGTPKQNVEDRIAHGTNAQGEASGNVKLTERKVRRIIELQSKGISNAAIARKFNVTRQTVRYIRIGHIWKHIERPHV